MFILSTSVIVILSVIGSHCVDQETVKNERVIDKSLEPIFASDLDSFPPDLESVEETIINAYTNVTIQDSTNTTNGTSFKYINCLKGFNGSSVQLVNDTELIKLLVPDGKISVEKDSPAVCIAVLFYSKNCPFSSMAAPHFNALPRAFPDIRMVAINAMRYHLFNTQNGIVGVPTLLIFHNGRPIARYSGAEYNLESFMSFFKRHTGIEPVKNSVVTSYDFTGPVISSPAKESDMFLIISWLFIIICSCYYFSKSKVCKWVIETIQRNWRESEQHIQHEHID
ncbi:thioredoxin domain-containing protein 15 [Sitophilus oryzae]|uniref:Thioredoxin domain-containing protein 15 n=1 Tax=Sitophilus oryzae TaxID=7048 RepID=A0A6J2Y5S3_SITOR|nr:thioredoxin domain-containing protein 15 [Sitophilus oryzae]